MWSHIQCTRQNMELDIAILVSIQNFKGCRIQGPNRGTAHSEDQRGVLNITFTILLSNPQIVSLVRSDRKHIIAGNNLHKGFIIVLRFV